MKISKLFDYEYEIQDSFNEETCYQQRDGEEITCYKLQRKAHSGYCLSELTKGDELYRELSKNDSLKNKINYQVNYLETINKHWTTLNF